MFYFKTEEAALEFAGKREYYMYVDFGDEAEDGRRYAVRVLAEEE